MIVRFRSGKETDEVGKNETKSWKGLFVDLVNDEVGSEFSREVSNHFPVVERE